MDRAIECGYVSTTLTVCFENVRDEFVVYLHELLVYFFIVFGILVPGNEFKYFGTDGATPTTSLSSG
jgi:hypothetical protein